MSIPSLTVGLPMRCVTAGLLALLMTLSVLAQDEPSGLKPGQYVPGPFHSFAVTGEHAGRLHCLVCASGLDPTVMVFTREVPTADKPLGQLLKQVDGLMARFPAVRSSAFVVVLSDDAKDYEPRQALAGKVADAAKAIGAPRVVWAVDTTTGPKGYGLDTATQDLIVFYHKHKVLASHSYGTGGLPGDDVSKVLKDIETTLTEIDRQIRPGRPTKRKPAGG